MRMFSERYPLELTSLFIRGVEHEARILKKGVPSSNIYSFRKWIICLKLVLTRESEQGKLEGVDPAQKGKGPCKRHNVPLRKNLR